MKYRLDFVTNSSSSSYILSLKREKGKTVNQTLKGINVKMSAYDVLTLPDEYGDVSFTVIDTIDKLDEYARDMCWEMEPGEEEEIYLDYKEMIENGEVLVCKTLDQHNYTANDLLRQLGEIPGITLIDCDG